jgi:hypothetical protein
MIDLRSLAIFGGLVALILVASAIVASAQNAPVYPSYRPAYVWSVHEWRDVNRTRRSRKLWREDYRPREEASGDRCRPQLAVVGDQFASESGAKAEADKAWMQTARWQWGERYMAREHAERVSYECGRSSVGSVVGQVFYRCRISARPCRPQPQNGDR